MSKRNKGGGCHDHTEDPGRNKTEIVFPPECSASFPPESNFAVHRIRTGDGHYPCYNVGRDQRQMQQGVADRKYSNVHCNV